MMNKKFYVKQSGIHGKGLFAQQTIRRGETIGTIKYNPVNEDGPHVLWVDEQGILVECELKYINHSSQPNACYCDDLQVVALKNINKDEEITHDYGDDWK
ncbi:MAG: SET domain-containing protein-lysine N-methyltransferase [Gammaproteobacteria bacterium]|nr:SET domain-containing protein-lysine N-methyltransferase [Gammaproteobacteria bacterium]